MVRGLEDARFRRPGSGPYPSAYPTIAAISSGTKSSRHDRWLQTDPGAQGKHAIVGSTARWPLPQGLFRGCNGPVDKSTTRVPTAAATCMVPGVVRQEEPALAEQGAERPPYRCCACRVE